MKRSDRDAELGKRLRRLEVPEHAPDFFAALEERLGAESAPRIRATPAPAGRRQETNLARRGWLRLAWVPVPVALVILALLWAFAGPLGVDPFRPQPASAAEVVRRVAAAVAEAKTLRGVLVVVSLEGEMRWTFTSTAEGDFRLTGLTREEDLGYDHRSGVQRALSGGDDGEPVLASEMTGLAAGPPDPGPADYMLERRLGAVVRALLDSPTAAVTEGTYEGRPVWTLSTEVQANRLSETSADHMEVTVDKGMGFPVRVVETRTGTFVQELRLEELELDPILAPDAFVVDFPAGVHVTRTDAGFRRIDLDRVASDAAAVVGYAPLLPAQVPAGFVLTDVAVAELGQPTGKEGMNPAVPGVVSAIYRRGFDRLIVSTRLVGDDPSLWDDPLASGEGFIDTPETVVLAAGAFSGSVGELLIDPRAVPHLWATNDTLVVTVSGDLTRAELLTVAGSLVPKR